MACRDSREQRPGHSAGNSQPRAETSICTAYLPVVRWRKAVASPTCAHRQPPVTFHSVPVIEKARSRAARRARHTSPGSYSPQARAIPGARGPRGGACFLIPGARIHGVRVRPPASVVLCASPYRLRVNMRLVFYLHPESPCNGSRRCHIVLSAGCRCARCKRGEGTDAARMLEWLYRQSVPEQHHPPGRSIKHVQHT